METQTVAGPSLPSISASERRRYPRTLSHVDSIVRTRDGCEHYDVANLSVCGALLVGGRQLPLHTIVEIDLHIHEHPMIRVMARVERRGLHDDGERYLGVEFLHGNGDTEDRIQAALLDEIERSQTHGIIPRFD